MIGAFMEILLALEWRSGNLVGSLWVLILEGSNLMGRLWR